MTVILGLLAYDREDLIIAALGGLMVAGVVVAIGAIVLLLREGRRRPRRPAVDPDTQPAAAGDMPLDGDTSPDGHSAAAD
jgi:hypothetical protein